jgi:hypothetical protein
LDRVKKLVVILCVLGAVTIAATTDGTSQANREPNAESIATALTQRIAGPLELTVGLNGQTTKYTRDANGSYSVLLNTPDAQAPHPVLEFRLLGGAMYARGLSEKLEQGEWLNMTKLTREFPELPNVLPPQNGEYNYVAWMTQDVEGHFQELSDVVRGFVGVTPSECFAAGDVSRGASSTEWSVDCKTGAPSFAINVDSSSRIVRASNEAIQVQIGYTVKPVVAPATSAVLTVEDAKKKLS